MALLLGIDTGGTYTDAVLFDDTRRVVLAAAKSLTTKEDLSLCVTRATEAALAKIPEIDPASIALVSLSTTLATNALVEKHRYPVALILIGQDERALSRAGLGEAMGSDPVLYVPGGHKSDGMEKETLGLNDAIGEIRNLQGRAAAVAICGYFGTRNPAHEIAVREAVRSEAGLPVTCAHELASALDAPRRALTAVLNARLVPMIARLIEAVEAMLKARDIDAPLMVVKGDGSVISAARALDRPVETILSGPAASVIGAHYLSGKDSCVISDIGGTTTDIATLGKGQPTLAAEGATVGGYRTMVEAIAVRTVGLGGDSEIGLTDDKRLRVGPRRMVPVSLLLQDHPDLMDDLRKQLRREWPSPFDGRFAVPVPNARLGKMSGGENKVMDALGDAPMALEALMKKRVPEKTLERLIDRGMVLMSGFTPSDASHVLGFHNSWNTEAAKLSADLHARTERRPGIPLAQNGETLARLVIDRLTIQSCAAITEAVLNDSLSPGARVIVEEAFKADAETEEAAIRFHVDLRRPLIGIGAPAATYYPDIAARLGCVLDVPANYDVCNAVGAVAGGIRQQVHIVITSPGEGLYRVHLPSGPEDFNALEKAAARGLDAAEAEAKARAEDAGAGEVTIETARDDRIATVAGTFAVFVESRLSATAIGKPKGR